ncbi:MAG: tryptophan--tRNA ligase [Gammaproteobacteria bacterium]|nr:MAG: tryptophan--tRNA ligase [Gammaproteobacteria bacterium]
MTNNQNNRILSGMRPTGKLHLGHYHGVLKNWVKLQHNYECFFFVADWHALTTDYENPSAIKQNTFDMVVDWLAVGIEPGSAKIFVQSAVPEHAELHLLLSMMTPLGWLERVPSYKDQQEKLQQKDLSTYGFLGYPLLQAADILLYKAGGVPVGEDQVAHIELTREVARRFNFLYGKEPEFIKKVEIAIKKMGKKNAKLYNASRKDYQEKGDQKALEVAQALLDSQQNISIGDKDRLFGFLEGANKIILPEPQALLTHAAKMPGLDGQKMSKSYNNAISLREDIDVMVKKVRTMPTDTARVRKTDVGDPDRCPVWQFHTVYSDDDTKNWVQDGCKNANIGCLQCKEPIIESITDELKTIQQRAAEYSSDKTSVLNIIKEGVLAARDVASETMEDVRDSMGLGD